MNTQSATTKKRDAVLTFNVVVALVAIALVIAAYLMIVDVMPAVHHFLMNLQTQPHHN